MHVAVDMDDVILDFLGGLRSAVKKEYDVTLSDTDFTEWNISGVLDPIIGRSWWSWMREREWIWATFPAVDGAIGAIDTMRRKGHYIEIVTSKPQWAEHNVWKWLGKWRPSVQRVTIVNQEEKVDVTDAALLIDDKPENCLGFMNAGREAILFDRPHNKHASSKDLNFLRGYDWQHVLDIVEALS